MGAGDRSGEGRREKEERKKKVKKTSDWGPWYKYWEAGTQGFNLGPWPLQYTKGHGAGAGQAKFSNGPLRRIGQGR